MINFNRHKRSTQEEIMDSVDFKGAEMQNLLRDLKRINTWLGGNSVTLDGIKNLLRNHPKTQELTILDIGCGDGNMLREVNDLLNKMGFQAKFIGIDFNSNILEYAKEQNEDYPRFEFMKVDVFLDQKLIPNSDIALFTLFLHHFSNEQITDLLTFVLSKVSKGIVINDLHRNKTAFYLFKLISNIFLKTNTAAYDGLVSIARGFTKSELLQIASEIEGQDSYIRWRWAFRYQWILEKIHIID